MASRANIFTGMYEYKTGCNFSHVKMQPSVWAKSYPVLLREAGYLTAFAGKFGLEVEGKGHCESEFDIWGGGPGQTDYKTAKNLSMKKYAAKYPHSTLSYAAFGKDVIRAAAKNKQPFVAQTRKSYLQKHPIHQQKKNTFVSVFCPPGISVPHFCSAIFSFEFFGPFRFKPGLIFYTV